MVLRGEQFRRFGPTGCALLTKQAPLYEISDLMRWGISTCLSYRTDWHPDTVSHGRRNRCWTRGGLVCHGARER
jgi:hypothetical protein